MCVRDFVFSCFFGVSRFLGFLCFWLYALSLLTIRVKHAGRIDNACRKVFVGDSLCYCEFRVSGRFADFPTTSTSLDFLRVFFSQAPK